MPPRAASTSIDGKTRPSPVRSLVRGPVCGPCSWGTFGELRVFTLCDVSFIDSSSGHWACVLRLRRQRIPNFSDHQELMRVPSPPLVRGAKRLGNGWPDELTAIRLRAERRSLGKASEAESWS